MPELDADFEISNNNLEANYEISEGQTFDCSFEIYAAGTTFSSITGDPYDNEALSDVLNQKADVSAIEIITEDINTITSTLDSFGDIVTYNASDFATSQQGNLADTALQPNDNVSELVNDAGYLVSSDLSDYATLNDLAAKQDIIDDLTDIRNDASEGASAYSTIQNYGDIVTYDASSFATSTQGQKADTALQPNDNITELNNNAGYITSASLPTVNNSTVKFQKNGTDIETITLNQSSNATVNFSIPTQASDINAVPTSRKVNNKALSADITLSASDVSALSSSTTINDLTTTAQQNALNSGATSTNIGQITTNTYDIADINDLIPTQATTTNQLADKSFVNSSIATNTANFIGTFNSVAELEAYSGTLTNNDYAFVETTDSAGNTLFDRYKYTTATTPASWQYEYELNNSSFTANQWASINSGITSNDVTLIGTALQPNDNVSSLINDAGYITSSSLPTVNNGTLTIQQNGTDVQTFTANQSSNTTANITVPTDTGDLTNGAGFITGITSGDVTTALGYTPYDNSNPNGYTSNVGTVTSVNNVSPVSGNVTLSIPTVNDGTLTVYQNNISKGTFTANQSSGSNIYLDDTTYNTFTGADSITGGTSGLVPAPGAGDENKVLKGDGTWGTISTSGANTDLSNLTATGEAHFLKNTATATRGLTILGGANSTYSDAVNIGVNSAVNANSSTVLGVGATANGIGSIAIGFTARASANYNIQIGAGTNSTARTVCIGGYDSNNINQNYQILDIETGLIPDARISSNIQRTSTAVTHTANTAVGDTTTPVYIASNGTATSIGLSIASSRFDGLWTVSTSYKYIANAVTINSNATYTSDISSALPSDTNKYIVVISGWGYTATTSGNTANIYVTTDLSSSFSDTWMLGKAKTQAGNAQHWGGSATVVVGTGRTIYIKNTGTGKTSDVTVWISAYRRVGTNS